MIHRASFLDPKKAISVEIVYALRSKLDAEFTFGGISERPYFDVSV